MRREIKPRYFLIPLVVPIGFLLLGCWGFGPGVKDYDLPLGSNLELVRSSASNVFVYSKESHRVLIESQVTGIAKTETRLFVEQVNPEKNVLYWIVLLSDETIRGPFEKDEFSRQLEEIGLSPVSWTIPPLTNPPRRQE